MLRTLHDCAGPKLARSMASRRVKLLPCRRQCRRSVAEIEKGEIPVRLCPRSRLRHPHARLFKSSRQRRDRMAFPCGLIDRDDLLVADQPTREIVEQSEIGAEDEGRTRHRPERKLRT